MRQLFHCAAILVLFGTNILFAQSSALTPAIQAKVDRQTQLLQKLADNAVIIRSVQEHNTNLPPHFAAMTQERWKSLNVLHQSVRELTKNEAALFLKANKTDVVGEVFLSGADGLKVAFLSKPTNWSHKGKPKHDVPMAGKTWQGPVEIDESTGMQMVQVSVPVLDNGKPIGSLVGGLVISKLTD